MESCEICGLTYSLLANPAGCPNRYRNISVRFRKPVLAEFTEAWHRDAGEKIKAHRAAQAAIKL